MNLGIIVSRNAKLYPNKIGVVDSDAGRRLTWQEFNQRVNQLANALVAAGSQKGDRMAIYSRNGHQYLELFFACAKTGIIAQPLNCRYTPDEIVATLQDGAPHGIIVSREYADTHQFIKKQLPFIACDIGLDIHEGFDKEYEEFIAVHSPAEPVTLNDVCDDEVFCLFNTGGTTGVAKSVAMTHRNALSVGLNIALAVSIRASDCYMIIGPMFHASITTALSFVLYGAKIVIMNFEPRRALEVIQRERVTSFLAIATILNYLLDAAGVNAFDASSLRLIIYGGAPISPKTLLRAVQTFTGVEFLQVMAQTESGVISLLLPEQHRLAFASNDFRLLQSCGRGALLNEVRIVDEADQEVPQDGKTPGEIIVRCDGVSKGYWNKPELTAATLRHDWWHTGDIATWDAEGFMRIVDRKKDMIISGGENIIAPSWKQRLISIRRSKNAPSSACPTKSMARR